MSDLLADGLLVAGLKADTSSGTDDALKGVGLPLAFLGGPAIHLLNGNCHNSLRSAGLRLAMGGGAWLIHGAYALSDQSSDTAWLIVGALAVSQAVDIAYFAYEDRKPASGSSHNVSMHLGIQPLPGGTAIRLGGHF